jgi:hypothetical protein
MSAFLRMFNHCATFAATQVADGLSAAEDLANLQHSPAALSKDDALQQVWCLAHGRYLTVGRRTLVMGILNVTPDSFSDGGEHADMCAQHEHIWCICDAWVIWHLTCACAWVAVAHTLDLLQRAETQQCKQHMLWWRRACTSSMLVASLHGLAQLRHLKPPSSVASYLLCSAHPPSDDRSACSLFTGHHTVS